MALPIPPAFTIGDYTGITDFEDRGSQQFSPSTTSTKAIPSAYKTKDVCGAEIYVKGGHNISVSKLVNCVPITIGSVSTKAFFSLGSTQVNMEALMDAVADELSAKLATESGAA